MAAVFLAAGTCVASEVRNGQFAEGLKGWLILRDGSSSLGAQEAATHCRFEDEGVIIDAQSIAGKATKPVGAVLSQYLGALQESGEYTLTFEVNIPAGEKVLYGLGMGIQGGPNKGNLGGGVVLTELVGTGEWVPVTASFRWDPSEAIANASDNNPGTPSLQFRIGLVKEFGIRNVSLSQ